MHGVAEYRISDWLDLLPRVVSIIIRSLNILVGLKVAVFEFLHTHDLWDAKLMRYDRVSTFLKSNSNVETLAGSIVTAL